MPKIFGVAGGRHDQIILKTSFSTACCQLQLGQHIVIPFYAFALYSVLDGCSSSSSSTRQQMTHCEHRKSVREKLHFKNLFKEEPKI
jgi:hypothetical protein